MAVISHANTLPIIKFFSHFMKTMSDINNNLKEITIIQFNSNTEQNY